MQTVNTRTKSRRPYAKTKPRRTHTKTRPAKAFRRTTISVPADLLAATDRAAHERGESRSRVITRLLRAAERERQGEEITRRLNVAYADPAIAEEQLRVAAEMERVATKWPDEGW